MLSIWRRKIFIVFKLKAIWKLIERHFLIIPFQSVVFCPAILNNAFWRTTIDCDKKKIKKNEEKTHTHTHTLEVSGEFILAGPFGALKSSRQTLFWYFQVEWVPVSRGPPEPVEWGPNDGHKRAPQCTAADVNEPPRWKDQEFLEFVSDSNSSTDRLTGRVTAKPRALLLPRACRITKPSFDQTPFVVAHPMRKLLPCFYFYYSVLFRSISVVPLLFLIRSFRTTCKWEIFF